MTTEKFDVLNCWTGKVAFTAEIETTPDMTQGWKLRLAVAWGLAASVPMVSLDLSGADFTGYKCPAHSRFEGSSFEGSSFEGSSFVGSRFVDSSFEGSSFEGSSFVGSRFVDSRFVGSSFEGSSFEGSSFVGSRFVDSSFEGSSFEGSSFVGSRFVDSRFVGSRFEDSSFEGSSFEDSRFEGSRFEGSRFEGSRFVGSRFEGSRFEGEVEAKGDFLKVIAAADEEIPGLVAALREGRIDGSTYSGLCACLVGTIANVRGVDVHSLETDSSRPAEVWFMMISKGDKPGDNTPGGYASGKALEWALEYCAVTGIEVPA